MGEKRQNPQVRVTGRIWGIGGREESRPSPDVQMPFISTEKNKTAFQEKTRKSSAGDVFSLGYLWSIKG